MGSLSTKVIQYADLSCSARGPLLLRRFALFDTSHDVVALVTQPPRVVRGKVVAAASPLRDEAVQRGTSILDPEDVNTAEQRSAAGRIRRPICSSWRTMGRSCRPRRWPWPARGNQSAWLAAAEVSRRGADQLGPLSR